MSHSVEEDSIIKQNPANPVLQESGQHLHFADSPLYQSTVYHPLPPSLTPQSSHQFSTTLYPFTGSIPHIPHADDNTALGATDQLSRQLPWAAHAETLSQQHHQSSDIVGNTADVTGSVQSYPPNMRYIHGPLEVLSAEQYDDGRYLKRPHTPMVKGSFVESLSPTVSKKRGRKNESSGQPELDEDTNKRTRGRPRLELSDDMDLKERRKAQIRMAQRAYRDRKDKAITTLEGQVANLRAVATDIKDCFKDLILDWMDENSDSVRHPELRRRIGEFQSLLVQKSNETACANSDTASSDMKHEDSVVLPRVGGRHGSSNPETVDNELKALPPTARVSKENHNAQPFYGGIYVTHEPETQPVISEDPSPPAMVDDSGASYTVVRYPNPDNASFSFAPNMMNSFQSYMPPPMDFHQLPLPQSNAYLETSFARRLQRHAVEQAVTIICMENPPAALFQSAFGFVLNYDTRDGVKCRLQRALAKGTGDDLNTYTQPFHRVGGNGTHYPRNTRNGTRSPNTHNGGAPFPNTGFGMGPYNARVNHVRDHWLDELQNARLPAWEGVWYDSEEVELYLRENGIIMPLDEGYVDVFPGPFYQKPDSSHQSPASTKIKSSASAMEVESGATDGNPNIYSSDATQSTAMGAGGGAAHYPSPVSSVTSMMSIPAPNVGWTAHSTVDTMGGAGIDFLSTMHHHHAQNAATSPAAHHHSLLTYPHNNAAFPGSGSAGYGFSTAAAGGEMALAGMPGHERKKVLINTNRFLEILVLSGTCVGRGPAFRKAEIVKAFWGAAKSP